MNLYVESSALLRWLLDDPLGEDVRALLADAKRVFASRLTLIETRRALQRASSQGEISGADAGQAMARFAGASARWTVVELLPEIGDRAAGTFPVEPVRTLDAVHLATALFVASQTGPVAVLSTDRRIARNAPLLGLPLALAG